MIASFLGKPIPSPRDDPHGGQKEGDDETHWRARGHGGDGRATAQVADEAGLRVQIWARMALSGERKVDVAREFGYRDGSGVLQVVEGLDRTAHDSQALARKPTKIGKILC